MFEEENFIYNTKGTGCNPEAKLSVHICNLSSVQLYFDLLYYCLSATGKPS